MAEPDVNADDRNGLARFVAAQDACAGSFRDELAAGRKTSHWMWFVFPQLAGLGASATARRYAIADLAHARAYLDHPVLGERLLSCTALVGRQAGRSAHDIFGSPDDLKFRSSMTLFNAASRPSCEAFRRALGTFFDGDPDPRTLELLARKEP